MNYYNEHDPFAAAWLRKLIEQQQIPQGVVDDRDIATVDPAELAGYTQCHFFAEIGGWSLALQLAGWPSTRPVWTGSPPCQPFSAAGRHEGKDDARHLWPVFFNLIRQCQPPTIFGEQVATAIGHGWFDDLRADLEDCGYAAAMVVLPACSVGAPHKRERLFFVGDSQHKRLERHERAAHQVAEPGWVRSSPAGSTPPSGVQLVTCRDGQRRVFAPEPLLQPLAYGLPNRVGILRGAGNAIVPQVGAEVIASFMEIENE